MRKAIRKLLKLSIWAVSGGIIMLILGNIWVNASSNPSIYQAADTVPAVRVAVVLGTSPYTAGGHNNLFFTYRMDAAAQLYKSDKVKRILVSGDNGNRNYDEPSEMRKALVKRGVPFEAIVLDYAGFRTLDSVVRAKEVFGQEEFVLVSQRFHLQRAIFIARSKGIKATGFQAKDPAFRSTRIKVHIREYFARIAAILDCYVLGTQPKFLGQKEQI